MESHLLQMRGLKLDYRCVNGCVQRSHLLQMRGLKPVGYNHIVPNITSHLLQMRGLKQSGNVCFKCINSRIFYRCVD